MLLFVAGTCGLLVTFSFMCMRDRPVLACGLLLTSIPLATVLTYGHVFGLPLSGPAKRRPRIERSLEALMQVLSCSPLLILVDPSIG